METFRSATPPLGPALAATTLAIALVALGCDDKKPTATVTASPSSSARPSASATAVAGAWKEVSEPGTFSITFPSDPTHETKTEAFDGGQKTTTDYVVWDGRDMYTLRHTADSIYAALPAASVGGVLDAAMKAKIGSYESGQGGKLLRSGDVTAGDVTGKEFSVTIETPVKGTNWVRLFIVGGQYYDVMVFVAADTKHDQHEKFFASFKPIAKK